MHWAPTTRRSERELTEPAKRERERERPRSRGRKKERDRSNTQLHFGAQWLAPRQNKISFSRFPPLRSFSLSHFAFRGRYEPRRNSRRTSTIFSSDAVIIAWRYLRFEASRTRVSAPTSRRRGFQSGNPKSEQTAQTPAVPADGERRATETRHTKTRHTTHATWRDDARRGARSQRQVIKPHRKRRGVRKSRRGATTRFSRGAVGVTLTRTPVFRGGMRARAERTRRSDGKTRTSRRERSRRTDKWQAVTRAAPRAAPRRAAPPTPAPTPLCHAAPRRSFHASRPSAPNPLPTQRILERKFLFVASFLLIHLFYIYGVCKRHYLCYFMRGCIWYYSYMFAWNKIIRKGYCIEGYFAYIVIKGLEI